MTSKIKAEEIKRQKLRITPKITDANRRKVETVIAMYASGIIVKKNTLINLLNKITSTNKNVSIKKINKKIQNLFDIHADKLNLEQNYKRAVDQANAILLSERITGYGRHIDHLKKYKIPISTDRNLNIIPPSMYQITFEGANQQIKYLLRQGITNIDIEVYKTDGYHFEKPFTELRRVFSLDKLFAKKGKQVYNKMTYKGFKDRFYYKIAKEGGSGVAIFYAKFVIRPIVEAKRFLSTYRDGLLNCLIEGIRKGIQAGQRDKPLNNDIDKKLKKLDEQFLISGVKLTNIPYIERCLKISISLKDKLNNIIYTSTINETENRQKITLTTPYINHVEFLQHQVNKKDLPLMMVEDVHQHYIYNESNFKYFKKDGKTLLYYYDDKNLYYQAYKIKGVIVNTNKYYIYNYETYIEDKFNEDNKLKFNIISKNDNEYIFNEINNSVHHLNIYNNLELINKINPAGVSLSNGGKIVKTLFNTSFLDVGINEEPETQNKPETLKELTEDEDERDDRLIKNTEYFHIDNNKCFVGWLNEQTEGNKYYKIYKMPGAKYSAYNINRKLSDIEFNNIMNTTSILKIKNIVFNNETLKAIEYFKESYNYTTPILKYALDNGLLISFEITLLITFDDVQLINFEQQIITAKYYNKLIGLMSSQSQFILTNFEYLNAQDLQNLLYYDNNLFYNVDNKTISILTPNTNIKNKAHIASFILSYSMINIFKVLKDVELKNLVYLHCDAITTLKPIKNIILDASIMGGFKTITPKIDIFHVSTCNKYLNFKTPNDAKNNLYSLSSQLEFNKQVSIITGEAGTGKSSQFLTTFENQDNRLYNSLFLCPSHHLRGKLNEKFKLNELNNYDTYQNFIKDTNDEKHIQYIKKFKYIILDESTMITTDNIIKIIKKTSAHRQKLIIIGDYDINKRISFQLNPVSGEAKKTEPDKGILTLLTKENHLKFNNKLITDIYYKHLTKNHRQTGDEFQKQLKSLRGKTNGYNKDVVLKDAKYKKIKKEDVKATYKLGDVVLCSTNNEIDFYNNEIYDKNEEYIQVQYLYTTNEHAKNEQAIIKRIEYSDKIYKKGYSISAHNCQGLTITTNIFISLNNLFTENLLYVMLSRANNIKQIYIINN